MQEHRVAAGSIPSRLTTVPSNPSFPRRCRRHPAMPVETGLRPVVSASRRRVVLGRPCRVPRPRKQCFDEFSRPVSVKTAMIHAQRSDQ